MIANHSLILMLHTLFLFCFLDILETGLNFKCSQIIVETKQQQNYPEIGL